jgi:hypothetical protein
MLPNDEEALSKLPQAYDSSFKEWITKQARAILPLLVEGVEYEENLDVQVILPTMRADKVFKVRYDGEEYILHLEFEASSDPDLPSRLLVYNAVLYRRHGKPVITLVIYPFSVTMAESPLVIGRGEREIHRFRFRTLSLGTMDAETCVRQHHTCLYPLLPTMHGLHADLMTQVLTEMSELYREHEETFSQQFTWIKLLLERTDTLQPLEKSKIWERLVMFDRLWEESPMVQKTKKQSYEQGRAEGVTQGITQGITQGDSLS